MKTPVSLFAVFALLAGFAVPAEAANWRIDFDSAGLLANSTGSDDLEDDGFNGASQLYHGRIMDTEYAAGIPAINLDDNVSIFGDYSGGGGGTGFVDPETGTFTNQYNHDQEQKNAGYTSSVAGNVGVTISARNFNDANPNNDVGAPLLFNTALTGTADSDLQDPFTANGSPLHGSLSQGQSYNPGHILIISEDITDLHDPNECTATRCSPVNDEGERPAGELIFTFDAPVDIFSFDVFDIEGDELSPPGQAEFYKEGEDDPFATIALPSTFGDNHWNRFEPNVFGVSEMVIVMGGSGGIDNIVGRVTPTTQVPEPGSLAIFASGVGLLGFVARRRRQERAAA